MRVRLLLSVVPLVLVGTAGPAVAAAPSGAAGPAASRWSPWKPIPSDPATLSACGTKVHLTFPVNDEEQRTRPLPAGATAIEVRGAYKVTFTPVGHPERAVTKDASGETRSPRYSIAYANGDFLYRASGANFFYDRPSEQQSSGLPELAVTYGDVSILFHRSSKGPQADVLRRPAFTLDICARLAG